MDSGLFFNFGQPASGGARWSWLAALALLLAPTAPIRAQPDPGEAQPVAPARAPYIPPARPSYVPPTRAPLASPAQAVADKTLVLKAKPLSAALPFEKIALVIGVSDYRNHAALPACEADAQRFAAFLREKWDFPDGSIRTLIGSEATPEKQRATLGTMLTEVKALVDNIGEDSEVVFFYSGHGTRDANTNEDYMVPMEGNAAILQTLVSLTQLRQQIETKKPRRALLIMDACRDLRAGSKAGGKGTGVGAGHGSAEPEIAELFSCQPLEVSQVGKDFPESVFTHYLLEGLGGAPAARTAEGGVTYTSLKRFLRGSVSQYVRNNFPGSAQNPTGTAVEGEMLLTGAISPQPLPDPPILNPVPPVINRAQLPPDGELHIGSTKINPKDGAEMVWVPAGEFTMGSNDYDDEKPIRKVFVDGYWIYKKVVTAAQYRRFCAASGREMPEAPNWGWKDDHPVVNVSWDDAKAYCDWAGVRLPTEAEWEKAARGTEGRVYPWGNGFIGAKLWSSVGGEQSGTTPVSSFPEGANPYGCLNMAGNVWQWCADWYGDYVANAIRNPTGPGFGEKRVLRGGAWDYNDADIFRAANRNENAPVDFGFNSGFRCAADP